MHSRSKRKQPKTIPFPYIIKSPTPPISLHSQTMPHPISILHLTLLFSCIHHTLHANPLNPTIDLLQSNNGVALPLYSTPHSSLPPTTQLTKFPFQYNLNLMAEIQMGSPPQTQKMILDTGSELSWLQCTQSLNFNPLLSSTYAPIPCSSTVCTTQTSNFPIPTVCNTNGLCQFVYSYADQTSVQGNLGTDTITLSTLKIPNFVFGCNILPPLPDTPGLMGLGRGDLSFISQIPQPKFSYCIAQNPNSPGILLLGNSPFSNSKYLHYTPLYTTSIPLPYFNRVAYSVRLQGIKVGKIRVGIPKSVFLPDHTGAGQTIIDSGTQFTLLLGAAYLPLREEFVQQNRGILNQSVTEEFVLQKQGILNQSLSEEFVHQKQEIFNQSFGEESVHQKQEILKQSDNGGFVFQGAFDLCFSRQVNLGFPQVSPVTLLFDNRVHIKLQSQQLLYKLPESVAPNGQSVYCFTFGNSDLVGIAQNIIGNFQQQNLWVEYDLQSSRIGFARANCHFN